MKGFTRYNFFSSDIFVTISRFGVTFSKGTVDLLDCSKVMVFFNAEKKQMAIKADENGDWRFSPDKHNGYVRWNVKHLVNKIKTFVDTEDKRFFGRLDCDEKAVIFDFNISAPKRISVPKRKR